MASGEPRRVFRRNWPLERRNNWENQSALFGFTQMNTAHDGGRLGRALFKIVKRIGIEHKVCDIHVC